MSRKNNKIHRSFHAYPCMIADKDGVILDFGSEMAQLAQDLKTATDLVEWFCDWELLSDFRDLSDKDQKKPSAGVARMLDVRIPQAITDSMKSGKSRFNEIVSGMTVDAVKSWSERLTASTQVKEKSLSTSSNTYISQGWERTVKGSQPTFERPKLQTSHADSQYLQFLTNPVETGDLSLKMVIGGQWKIVAFDYDLSRFADASKITKPTLTLDDDGRVRFSFTAEYPYVFTEFSKEYVIGVDVGVSNYVTAVVYRAKDHSIVEGSETTLSADVHSLVNKVKNTNLQISRLHQTGRSEEVFYHRESNSHRKRELAIKAAQELAEMSATWGNAIVVFEDLSWISDTMQNGRWNRGELLKWTEHFINLNGGRISKVSAYKTSQICHECAGQLTFLYWHTVICESCDLMMDRDENAAANIAKRFVEQGTHDKFVNTRKKSKKSTKQQVIRVKSAPHTKRKHPKPDRTKNVATPKRRKRKTPTTRRFDGLEVISKKLSSSKTTVFEGSLAKVSAKDMTLTSSYSNKSCKRRYRLTNLD